MPDSHSAEVMQFLRWQPRGLTLYQGLACKALAALRQTGVRGCGGKVGEASWC